MAKKAAKSDKFLKNITPGGSVADTKFESSIWKV